MKNLFIFNVLIISGLSINAQNINNVQIANIDNSPNYQQGMFNSNPNNNIHTNIQTQGNLGGGAARLRNKIKKPNMINQKQVVNNKPQKLVQGNVGNVFDNVGENNVNIPIQVIGRGNINEVNFNVNDNPQINNPKLNKPLNNKSVVVIEEYKGLDFKPIGLSDRDYNGGQLKKGQKNFYKPAYTKHKNDRPKRKTRFKKVKYYTSKCATW